MALVLEEMAAEEIIAAVAADVAADAAAAAAAAGAAEAAGGGSVTVPAWVTTAAQSMAASFVLAKLFPPDVGIGKGATAQTFLANSLSNMDPIPVIYGSRRIGASVIEVGLTSTEIQSDRLHRVAIWGEGPISAVQALYLDTVISSDARFLSGAIGPIEHYLGSDSQAASAMLIAYLADSSKWNANCTLAGVAYTYLSLVWNPTIYPHGRPALTADVDGRTLYDPRSGTTAFSRNPALAIRDYLTNTRYGRGVPSSMIDDTAFADAAYHCDDLVTVPDGAGGTTTQKRYTCDGVLNVDQTPLDNLKALLTACRGFIVFSGGKYKLRIDRDETISGSSFGYDFTGGAARQFAGGVDTPLSVTRAGSATRVNSAGLVEVVAANTARLDFDPATLACKGILIEEAGTNLVLRSEDFSVAPWDLAGSAATIAANQVAAPDGNVAADKLRETAVTGTFFVGQINLAKAASALKYTWAVYLKAGERSWGFFTAYSPGTTNGARAFFNLATGVVGSFVNIGAAPFTGLTAEIKSAANGFYRCIFTFTTDTGVLLSAFVSASTADALDTSYAGTLNSGLYMWGADLKQAPYASSYVPTTSAAVTRNADVPVIGSLGSWFNGVEGTVVAEFDLLTKPTVNSGRPQVVYEFSDDTDNERYGFYAGKAGGDTFSQFCVDGGVLLADTSAGAVTSGTVHRAAAAFKANDFSVSLNGAAAATDTSVTMATVTKLYLGSSHGVATRELNGHLRKLGCIPRRVSDAELQALSSLTPFVLNTDNIVGGWSIQLGSKRNRFNRVRARFFNKDASWQPDYAVYEDLAHRVTDAAQVLEQTLDLPYTRNVYTAAQIAQIEEKRSRFGTLVSLTATIAATALEVGDVAPLAHATPGWPAAGDPAEGKLFRVIDMELLASDEVRLTLLEYSASVYSLTTPPAQVTAPATTSLPDLSTVVAPGTPSVVETLYQTSSSAGYKSRATITWGTSNDAFVQRGGWYQLERSPAGAGTWTIYPQILAPGQGVATVSFIIDDIAPGSYDWRVAAFNLVGAKSPYSPTTMKEFLGLNAPPSNVANFAAQNYAGMAKFTWDKPSTATDLAVVQAGRIYVRWSPKTSGASWDYGSLVNPDGYPGDTSIGLGPLMAGTYMAKMWNGRSWSVTEAMYVLTEALLTGLATLATVTESPGFAGAKSNVALVDGGIQLDGTTLIDSMLTNIDTWSAIDSLGGVQGSGSYTFGQKMDLGSKRVARLFSSIDSLAYATDDFIDSRTDNIDNWGLFDGVVIGDVEVQLWVRTTDNDPNGGSPTWSAWERLGLVADYNFRGFDFRLDFATASPTHNRTVTALSVTAKS